MIKSMTGYGSAKGTVEGLEISVELKSVNNKFLDAAVRMPRSFLFAESAVKSLVQQHISRGKVDVFVTVDSSMADDMTVRINEPLLRGYLEAIEHIAEDKYPVGLFTFYRLKKHAAVMGRTVYIGCNEPFHIYISPIILFVTLLYHNRGLPVTQILLLLLLIC